MRQTFVVGFSSNSKSFINRNNFKYCKTEKLDAIEIVNGFAEPRFLQAYPYASSNKLIALLVSRFFTSPDAVTALYIRLIALQRL